MSSTTARNFFKLARTGALPSPPAAITHEALLAKSKLHARKSIEAKSRKDATECQLWAATSLELLAKAHLAGIHPSLVVEADKSNLNVLLEASGINTGTALKTIGAAEAYARLKHTVPNFTTPVSAACKKLADRRNAELHSGDAACAAIPYEAWEGDFWNASALILGSMDMDLKEWLGANDAKAPAKFLKAHREALASSAKQRVKHHAAAFKETAAGKLKGAALVAFIQETWKIELGAFFRYKYHAYWREPCPACMAWAWVGGDEDWEGLAEDQSVADPGYQIVETVYATAEFYCPTCQLSLMGTEALGAAGVQQNHTSTVELEIEYEPDYGND